MTEKKEPTVRIGYTLRESELLDEIDKLGEWVRRACDAIKTAITDEDGLDGLAGERLLREVGYWLADQPSVADASRPVSEGPPKDRWEALKALPKDWDSYGAEPLDAATVDKARAFLAAASVGPTVMGGVQIEWHIHGLDIEIEFLPDGSIEIDGVSEGPPTTNDADVSRASEQSAASGPTGSPRSPQPKGSER
jgi:hypothetical protein